MSKTDDAVKEVEGEVVHNLPVATGRRPVSEQQVQLEELNQAVLDQFNQLSKAIPEPDDDGGLQIALAIFKAATVEDLDRPWAGRKLSFYRDTPITIHALKRLPSDYTGGLGEYYVMDCSIKETGESFAATTGSVSTMVQLAVAHSKGMLPLTCIPRVAKRASRKGYFPEHLEVFRGA